MALLLAVALAVSLFTNVICWRLFINERAERKLWHSAFQKKSKQMEDVLK